MKSDGVTRITEKRFQRGGVAIETIATLLLLLLTGIGIFTLSITSTAASKRINDSRGASSRARVALSFVNMKIRQNDRMGAVEVIPNPINGSNSLVIHEDYDEERYDTWIYWHDGKLYEALVLDHEQPSLEVSLEITKLDDFSIESTDRRILHTQVTASEGEKAFTYESHTALRSVAHGE